MLGRRGGVPDGPHGGGPRQRDHHVEELERAQDGEAQGPVYDAEDEAGEISARPRQASPGGRAPEEVGKTKEEGRNRRELRRGADGAAGAGAKGREKRASTPLLLTLLAMAGRAASAE